MEYSLKNKELKIYFSGSVSTENIETIKQEVQNIIDNNEYDNLILDFKDLKYISSVGLRLLLKLKQSHNNFHIVEVNDDVYEILSMTGFNEIMDIKRQLKEIDVSNAEIIGSGYFSTVYRIDKDTIVKVFNRVSDDDQIDRELKLAKEAFVLGIPTAISFDVVKVNDKYGLRFEMLDCISLKDAFKNNIYNYDDLVDKYANLLITINSTPCDDELIPNMNDFYHQKLEDIKEILAESDYLKLKKMMEGIDNSNTLVHGDCHFKNIMIQNDEFLLIDMDTLSVGNPIFELSQIRAAYVGYEEDEPGNCARFFGLSAEFCKKLYEDIVLKYLGSVQQENLDKIAIVCYLHMLWWNQMNESDNTVRLNGCKGRLISLLKKYDNLILDK